MPVLLNSIRDSVNDALLIFSDFIHIYPGRTLLSLLALGKYAGGSKELAQDFKNFGVLHLLVLSGSQVSCFAKVWEQIPRAWGWKRGRDQRKREAFCWAGLLVFFCLVPSDPPIVRALLMECLILALPRLRLEAKIAFALGLQILLFPGHLLKLGFYLSWVCWALLHLCQAISLKWVQSLVLIVLCQLTAILLTGSPLPNLRTWLLLGIANLLLLNLFEKWIFPLTAAVLSLAVLAGPILILGLPRWVVQIPAVLMGPFLNGGYGLVLVALDAFRYIQ